MSVSEIDETELGGVAGFIVKTYQILQNDEFAKVIHWCSNGEEFIIRDAAKLQYTVLPRYFRHNKISSFVRQLNMYDFHKSRKDHSMCVFSHPSFLRGREELLSTIKRKAKSRGAPTTPIKKQKEKQQISKVARKEPVSFSQELGENENIYGGEHSTLTFNIMGEALQPFSTIDINISLKLIPENDIRFQRAVSAFDEDDVSISIGRHLEEQQQEEEVDQQVACPLKLVNPSCFFDSMQD